MKQYTKIFAVAAVLLGFTILALLLLKKEAQNTQVQKDSLKIGVLLYRSDDVFISSLRQEIEEYVKAFEKDNPVKVNIEVVYAAGDQALQDRQAERFISLDYDVLCVNPVDRTNVSNIIDKCMQKDIPLVFFNRRPSEDDMKRYEKLYYVGVDPKEEATEQGNILVELYRKDAGALDLNGNGMVEYVFLEGEVSHQDSLIRTKWSIQTLQDAGVPIHKLAGGIANWERSQASALMEAWLEEYASQIELVISNNDDMAMGALEAIERKNDLRGIKVVGIDGIPAAIESVRNGKMYGTVANDIDGYAKAIIHIAVYASLNKAFPEEISARMTQRYYKVGQEALTGE